VWLLGCYVGLGIGETLWGLSRRLRGDTTRGRRSLHPKP